MFTLLESNISPFIGPFEDDYPFPKVGYVSSRRVHAFPHCPFYRLPPPVQHWARSMRSAIGHNVGKLPVLLCRSPHPSDKITRIHDEFHHVSRKINMTMGKNQPFEDDNMHISYQKRQRWFPVSHVRFRGQFQGENLRIKKNFSGQKCKQFLLGSDWPKTRVNSGG